MAIELSASTEELLNQQLSKGDFESADELIAHALGLVQAESFDWLLQHREEILRSIEEGRLAGERGELYTPEEAQAMLADRRAARARQAA